MFICPEDMKKNSLLHRCRKSLNDLCDTFLNEMKNVFKDQGLLIFFIVVPFGYPLLYSWLYNNEVMKDVPTVFVDESHSFMSRSFIRHCDATEGIKVERVVGSLEEAKEAQRRQECHGIVFIPQDFDLKINRGEQTTVSFFADLSGMLYYKGIYAALIDVSLQMGKSLQVKHLKTFTQKDEDISTAPLQYDSVALFNPQGGYGSFLLPAVLMLIIHQTLLLGIGMSRGTKREKRAKEATTSAQRTAKSILSIVFGKSLCYFTLYLVTATYIALIVPRLFHFVHLADAGTLIALLVPYLLACIFFGMTLSAFIKHREDVILLILFSSIPLLLLSGVSWPGSAIPTFWKALSYFFPSTFGVNGFVKINSFGAQLADIRPEYIALWIQAAAYFFTTCISYRLQLKRR